MKLQILLLSFLIFFLIRGATTLNVTTICSYEETVEVINQNGSYKYENLEIPKNLVQTYNYKYLVNGTRIPVDNYARGCICKIKRCLRVCTDGLINFYKTYNDTKKIDYGYIKNITLSNGTEHEMHLIKDFHHIVDRVCTEMYQLDPERNPNMDWTLYENGNLLRHDDQTEFPPDKFCFDVDVFNKTENGTIMTYFLVNPYNCGLSDLPWNMELNAYAMTISIPFFIVTIIIFCCLPYLRNSYGKCFISYLIALATSYTLISFLILYPGKLEPLPCQLLGYSVYYTVIAYLTWTCVISYDTYKTLTNMVGKSPFRIYSVVGWLVPLLLTFLTYTAQKLLSLPDELKPGIDDDRCGVNTYRWSACIYFYVPCIAVLTYSLVLYVKVLRYIGVNEHTISPYKKDIKESHKIRFFFYFRLFIFMGVSWFFDILSYFLKMTIKEKKFILSIPDMFNASQGAFIFLLFICRKEIWIKVREKLRGRRTHEHRIVTQSSTMEL